MTGESGLADHVDLRLQSRFATRVRDVAAGLQAVPVMKARVVRILHEDIEERADIAGEILPRRAAVPATSAISRSPTAAKSVSLLGKYA